MPNYWLMKSEPSTYSIEDLAKEKNQTTTWEGVRNYQARNLLRDDIKKGDRVLFYHSNAKPMAVVGTATVVKEGYPDPFQFDPKSKYHDPKSNPEDPRWFMVDIRLDEVFNHPVTLHEIKEVKSLSDMKLVQRGQRLSVQPVRKKEWDWIVKRGSRA